MGRTKKEALKITDVRLALSDIFNLFKEGKGDVEQAKTMSNIAGRMMQTVTTQLKYDKTHGKVRKIDFVE